MIQTVEIHIVYLQSYNIAIICIIQEVLLMTLIMMLQVIMINKMVVLRVFFILFCFVFRWLISNSAIKRLTQDIFHWSGELTDKRIVVCSLYLRKCYDIANWLYLIDINQMILTFDSRTCAINTVTPSVWCILMLCYHRELNLIKRIGSH